MHGLFEATINFIIASTISCIVKALYYSRAHSIQGNEAVLSSTTNGGSVDNLVDLSQLSMALQLETRFCVLCMMIRDPVSGVAIPPDFWRSPSFPPLPTLDLENAGCSDMLVDQQLGHYPEAFTCAA